ncbi:NAD(P)/FAD-dependent oxidoreductase [Nocardia cyriacigeorgica]|uniref:NAD(P)/FAD-dependent oxidoreductase n=1 Tax=Nocardia cyriacigeorgica TaxID=135487 RepID=A0A6P1D8W5_9NOCA|nr:NAD(P)/FAD-dependent oxidoreductase [Nocardia cyriacigeorgica]NEW45350.1 NAD(P)/FAD-dependent oxidoreductase [Nocardia cyriacigeorgica]NEW48520.1 NAD(P)/FAD-dependent oxidoreductase [Nocardia cyriacigeorgica]NEW59197.1 NAD(P)/FAD-dependent oxidoreductase [Nocardia cyriacigeorgica]
MADSSSTAVEYTDVIVVGARCAGSAVAITMAAAGRRVVVLDSAHFPSDTLSTHLLWPGGLAELRALGVLDQVEQLGAPRLTSAFAAGGGYRVPSEFTPADGIDYAMCVRRTGLDAVLVGAARAAGADVRERRRVIELVWAHGRCTGVRYRDRNDTVVEVRARLVVGADGRRSTVARLCGASEPFLTTPSGRECYYAYWRDGASSWRHIAAQWRAGRDLGTAFPCDDGLLLSLVQPPVGEESGVGPGRAEQRYSEAITRIPGLTERLRDCERVGRVRSATGIASYFRLSSGPGWALAGDAGHFKDPVTAQGIRDALRYGRLLAETAAPLLEHPKALDIAMAHWADRRLRDCLPIYQWTNRLARAEDMHPLEIELYRTATRDPSLAAAVTGIFSRTTEPGAVFTPRRAVGLAAGAVRHSPTAAGAVLADVTRELRDAAADWHEARTALRSTRRPLTLLDSPALADHPFRAGDEHV